MMRRVTHVGYAHSRSAACGRLRSDGGFTLGEVLATVVLVGLLTLAIAAGIGIAVNVYGEIRGHSEEQGVLNDAVTAVADELRFAYDVNGDVESLAGTGNGVQPVVFSSPGRDVRMYVGNKEAEEGRPACVVLYGAGAHGDGDPEQDSSMGDWQPLSQVNTAAGASGDAAYAVQLTRLTWDEATGLWIFALTVTGGDQPVESGDITVRSVNTW